jgi:hypothetical protein
MGSALRNFLVLMLVLTIPVYFIFLASEGLLMQIAGAILILLLLSMLLFTNRGSVPSFSQQSSEPESMGTVIGDIELPPPVLSEPSASETREEKISRSRGRKGAPEPNLPPVPELPPTPPAVDLDFPMPATSQEGMAEIYVAQSDPEMQQEAEVDLYLAQKKLLRNEIREKMIRERRMEKSERVAVEASKWSDSEDGEDLSTLLKIPGHGLAVFFEPEHPDPNIPQGISYFRVDDQRALKIRMSLDVERTMDGIEPPVEAHSEEIPPLDASLPLPPPPGMPPLPPPGMPDLPPPVEKNE